MNAPRSTTMTDPRAAALAVGRGFVPWIVYWSLSGPGLRTAGVLSALAVALILVALDFRRRRLGPIEATAAALFAMDAVLTLGLGLDVFPRWDAALLPAALAAMAWGSLAGRRPFTAAYARPSTPPVYWTHPLFVRINMLITAVWGAVFLMSMLLGLAAIRWPSARLLLLLGVSQAGHAAAIAASIVLPRWVPRRWAERQIAAQEPYRWPAPVFGRGLAGDDTRGRAPGGGRDVIVVGSGIGGLTAAALLARRGLDVLVLEQHYLPGGFCTSWPRLVRRGTARLRYVFDAGVHDVSGLGQRGAVRRLLCALDLEQRLEWRRVTQEYVLPSLRLKVPDRAEDFVAALARAFPREAAALRAFFAEMEDIYRDLYADIDATGGVPCPPRTPEALLAWPERHPHAFRWMDVPFGVMLDRFFQDARLKHTLSVLTGYLSDDPMRLSAWAMAPIFGYYFDGGFYPTGGSQAFADTLVAAIREHGGEVRLRTPVRRIVVEGGRAIGVQTADGGVHRAAAVVSNADARRTFLELVGADHLPADFVHEAAALRPSTSAFMVFLGVDFVPGVEPITIVVGGDGTGFGISVPSKVDPSLAPPGHAAVTLVAFASPDLATWDRRGPGYGARKRAEGDRLIAAAEAVVPGLRERVVYRQDGTPATFARYAWTTGGAIYGPAIGWRPPAKSPVEALVLSGAGVFPGAGVEAVVISGTLAADALYPAPKPAAASALVAA